MSELNEFAINLPISSVPTLEPQSTAVTGYDITADTTIPPDISSEHKHISVYVVSADMVDFSTDSPNVCVDIVLGVNVNQGDEIGSTKSYKLVKRISMDRIKLALQAEGTECQVVEHEDDPTEVERMMTEFYAAKRARELVGLPESAGNKVFNVLFKYRDKNGKDWASATVKIDAVKDAAHARHVFAAHHEHKHPETKITRVTEVKPQE